MHGAASNIVEGDGYWPVNTPPRGCTGGISGSYSYVLPLKRRRSLVSRAAVDGHRVGHSARFASTREPDATPLEVARRQSARHLRAGETAAAPTHFTPGECRPAAWGASAPAMVSHRVHQHRRRDLAGNTAAA